MNKQTKRIRRNRKNKTHKYYGGAVEVDDKSKGIFDIIGSKLSGYSGKAFNYVKDKGLRFVCLLFSFLNSLLNESNLLVHLFNSSCSESPSNWASFSIC